LEEIEEEEDLEDSEDSEFRIENLEKNKVLPRRGR
jgi:hypothetical protein